VAGRRDAEAQQKSFLDVSNKKNRRRPARHPVLAGLLNRCSPWPRPPARPRPDAIHLSPNLTTKTQAKLASPFIAVPLALGMAVGSVTKKGVDGFYRTLTKPGWTPPNGLFPLAWSVLYVCMGTAVYLAQAAGAGADAMKLYKLQLALNLAWSPLFFLAEDLTAALVGIVALDAAALATGKHFAAASARAGQLWAPYLAWLAFATLLTAKLWLDNPGARAGAWRGGGGGGRVRARRA
jgi:tryptophan-rich sensory protein